MNILIVCKRYYTNKDLIQDKFGRLYHFPVNWVKSGHNVTVLALNYKFADLETFNVDGVSYYSVPFPSLFINSIITINKLASAAKPSVILASGDSYIGYWALRLANRLKTPFVFDLYHDYRDFGSNKILGMKFLFNAAVQNADLIACDSSVLAKRMQILNRNTAVMPQGVDINSFRPMNKQDARGKLGLNFNGIYIGYTGSFDLRFDYECVMRCCEKLRAHYDVKLLLAGTNIEKFDFNKPYIDYLGVRPQTEIADVISACDVMTIPYKDVKLSDTCNPCKLTEYIACQRPIVVSEISDLMEYLANPEPSVYRPSDHEDFSSKLVQQIESPILQNLSTEMLWSTIAEKYLRYLQQIDK